MIDQNSRYSRLIAGIAALQTGNARRYSSPKSNS